MNIRPEETAFVGSAKGVYLLQLFADVHVLYANKYLHKVDADEGILVCEAYNIATRTAVDLESLLTLKADAPFRVIGRS